MILYQPCGEGGPRSPLAVVGNPYCPLNPKWMSGGPKMADGIWKGSISKFMGTPVNYHKIGF